MGGETRPLKLLVASNPHSSSFYVTMWKGRREVSDKAGKALSWGDEVVIDQDRQENAAFPLFCVVPFVNLNTVMSTPTLKKHISEMTQMAN